ncbi:MAG: chemotaxis response regulator protein-glutamate methylesterase [Acidobacteriota bacterium]|nr:chemotaxis response regulator protein-glutamate methylesterase [Acidobacteriota bacterium]
MNIARALPPGSRIRVLIVDDSVVIRRLITHVLSEDPEFEIVGSASDGALALQRIPQVQPDVITLDIEMPVLDGLATLRQIRKLYPKIRVIMFSTLTERGAAASMEALSLGANDYVTKAASAGSFDLSMEKLRSDLIPKIKQFFHVEDQRPERLSTNGGLQRTKLPGAIKRPYSRQACSLPKAILIGVSTGGPNALAALMPMFPKDFELPILIVQHMPPIFTKLLAERLNTITHLSVEEAAEGSIVGPGKVLIAPGNHHMRVCRANDGVVVTELNQDSPENSCRPAVDVMFRSAAQVYRASVIAVVLTGMGNDGVIGASLLQAQGAYIIAQDEASSVVWGMPRGVIEAGLADAVVDLNSVVPEILKQI